MPFDLPAPRSRQGTTLRETVLELMLRSQIDPALDETALRADLRGIVEATRRPAEDLWTIYAAGRSARRSCHAALTVR